MRSLIWIFLLVLTSGCVKPQKVIVKTLSKEFKNHKRDFYDLNAKLLELKDNKPDIHLIISSESTQRLSIDKDLIEIKNLMKKINVDSIRLYSNTTGISLSYDRWISSVVTIETGELDSIFSPSSGLRSISDLKQEYNETREWAFELEPGWTVVSLKPNL